MRFPKRTWRYFLLKCSLTAAKFLSECHWEGKSPSFERPRSPGAGCSPSHLGAVGDCAAALARDDPLLPSSFLRDGRVRSCHRHLLRPHRPKPSQGPSLGRARLSHGRLIALLPSYQRRHGTLVSRRPRVAGAESGPPSADGRRTLRPDWQDRQRRPGRAAACRRDPATATRKTWVSL